MNDCAASWSLAEDVRAHAGWAREPRHQIRGPDYLVRNLHWIELNGRHQAFVRSKVPVHRHLKVAIPLTGHSDVEPRLGRERVVQRERRFGPQVYLVLAHAAQEHVSVSEVIRRAIGEYLRAS